jgi:acetylornithine deacetylase/succinyl-diaminopimelate desuccinylase-like protein
MVGPAGAIGGRAGAITCAADSLQIRLFGRGAHGSMPQASIDPVVMAAATVMRLQTIVSRELAAAEAAVVTIGSLQAGTKENVIPEEAVAKLNVRSFEEGVRQRVLDAIERRQRRGRGLGRPPAAADHAARQLSPRGQRSRGEQARRRCVPPALFRRPRARDRTGAGQ